MAETLKALILDSATGEVSERPFTSEEVSAHNARQEQAELEKAEREAKATARESALAKLAALGLTADEVAAL